MRNRHVFYVLASLLLVVIFIVIIADARADAEESWKRWGIDLKNSLLESVPLISRLSDRTFVQLNFYPVEDWELEVCTRDISMNNRPKNNVEQANSMQLWYTGTAIALAGTKHKYTATNDTLYTLEWYVVPESKAITYSVYLNNSLGKPVYISRNIEAEPRIGSGDSFSDYYTTDYTYLGIIYTVEVENGENTMKYMESEIVNDKAIYE
jgi:hypothetical protein